MSSLSAKDRASLCSFTFSDGRRCRTPRINSRPHFCFYHAQKEARARAAQKLGKDLAYFFSGDYLSACDLSTALGRLIPAVLRGDVKPRAARTVAYPSPNPRLLRSGRICGANNLNHPNRSPSPPRQSTPPQPVATPSTVCHPERSEGSHPIPAALPAPPLHTSLPPKSAEFVQHVVAGLKTRRGQAPQPQLAPPSSPTSGPLTNPRTTKFPDPSTPIPSSVLQEWGSSATRSSASPSLPGIDGKLF